MTSNDSKRLDWFRLYLSENVGPATFKKLLDFFSSPTKALDHVEEWAKRGGAKHPIKIADITTAEKQLEMAEKLGVKLFFSDEPDYPQMLKQISDYPPILFTLGHPVLFSKQCVALVGTRAATLNGKTFASKIAQELAEHDYVIVSGMAKGIDRAAHIGALNCPDKGGTIAVLGTPIDTAYPPENQDLYNEIKERGCLISEFPFGTALIPQNFPRRNRIISGLSVGVVVIEANLKSGSLITAKEALSQGRDVFAVPGSPLDPRAAGPNALIQEGATLVTKATDIIDTLNNNKTFRLSDTIVPDEYQLNIETLEKDIDKARAVVLENLGPEMVGIDDLIRATNLTPRIVNVILTQLELAGRLEHFPGNRIALIYGEKE